MDSRPYPYGTAMASIRGRTVRANGIPLTFPPLSRQEAHNMTTTVPFGLTLSAASRGTSARSFAKKFYFSTPAGHD